jgi:hypothetical protein
MPRAYVWRSLLHLGLFGLFLVPVHYLVASPARNDLPWDVIGGSAVLQLVSLGVMIHQLSRKEY